MSKEHVRLIDANRLLCVIDDDGGWAYDGLEYQAYMSCLRGVLEDIEEAPTIDPESLRPAAKWIEAPDEGADGSYEACSRCAWESRWSASKYKYCPHCGARMVNADE